MQKLFQIWLRNSIRANLLVNYTMIDNLLSVQIIKKYLQASVLAPHSQYAEF